MQPHSARRILQSLVQGVDPVSGDPLGGGTVLQRAEVMRALLAALVALEQSAGRSARRAMLPVNVGRPWTEEEEQALMRESQEGHAREEIAIRHGRTLRAIEARLEKCGLMSAAERVTRDRFSHEPKN